jgi:hypothetical protein
MVTSSKKISNTSAVSTASTKKPVAKKIVAATPVKKAAATVTKKAAPIPAKKVSAPKAEKPAGKASATAKNAPTKSSKKNTVKPEERHHMIATAAYFRAEQRGFSCGCAKEDWIHGEAQIDAMLNS